MKKVPFILLFILIIYFLFNINWDGSSPHSDSSPPQSSLKDQKDANELDKLSQEVLNQFQALEEAVKSFDLDTFLHFHHEENQLFYQEQKRWLEEVIYKSERDYHYHLNVEAVDLTSPAEGMLSIQLDIQTPVGERINHQIQYTIISTPQGWKIHDFHPYVLTEGTISIYYFEEDRELAEKILKDTTDIVLLYQSVFNWEPQQISIKLYQDAQQLAASIPWPMIGGWYEKGESIKIVSSYSQERTFQILVHELSHHMLADLTNDNAAPYLKEGLATLSEYSVTHNEQGELTFNHLLADDKALELLDRINRRFLTIDELNTKTFDETATLYSYGFLLTNYLIQKFGLEKYVKLTSELAQYPYIDQRLEHKLDSIILRTSESLEAVYGPLKELSRDYQLYYFTENDKNN